jgi:hypothetical protein
MHSFRVLGIIALCAVVVAVICFTVVDTSIDSANGCLGTRVACREHVVPPAAIAYAVIGALSLLVSALFAGGWVLGMLRHPEPDESHPHPGRTPILAAEEDEA